jgi:aminoglycoside phosphotransferase (APT) family kinase protein
MTEILDAQTAFTGSSIPEGKDAIDEAKLGIWMQDNVAGFIGSVEVRKFAGGQSNPTYKLTSPGGSYVLRRKPLGPLLPSAHAVDREFKVISGLYPTGFPVAKPYALCTDDTIIGSWFYIMDMVEGRTIWDGAMPGAQQKERRETYFAMIDTLAALHSVDVEAAGLFDYGKPGNYFERQVSRWTKQYRAAQTEVMPEMESLIEWLPTTLPAQDRVSIVHGDYRIDNMIFDAVQPKVRAVLDWELGTLGDPLADFTYVAMAWVTDNEGRSGVQDIDRKALGIPELDEVVARYCTATGRGGIPDLNWYFAFNFFRLAGIIQGIKKRVIEGTATSAHAVGMSERVYPLAQAAWHFANQAGAKGKL